MSYFIWRKALSYGCGVNINKWCVVYPAQGVYNFHALIGYKAPPDAFTRLSLKITFSAVYNLSSHHSIIA